MQSKDLTPQHPSPPPPSVRKTALFTDKSHRTSPSVRKLPFSRTNHTKPHHPSAKPPFSRTNHTKPHHQSAKPPFSRTNHTKPHHLSARNTLPPTRKSPLPKGKTRNPLRTGISRKHLQNNHLCNINIPKGQTKTPFKNTISENTEPEHYQNKLAHTTLTTKHFPIPRAPLWRHAVHIST